MSKRSKIENSIKNCYSTWGETYHDEYYGEDAPYPPIHLDLVKKILLMKVIYGKEALQILKIFL